MIDPITPLAKLGETIVSVLDKYKAGMLLAAISCGIMTLITSVIAEIVHGILYGLLVLLAIAFGIATIAALGLFFYEWRRREFEQTEVGRLRREGS